MRMLICATLLLCAGAAYAATLATVEYDASDPAQQALVKQLIQVQATADKALVAALDSTADVVREGALTDALRDYGVTVRADSLDSQWVRVQLPLEAAKTIERAFLLSQVQAFVADGGEDVGNGLVRTRADWAEAGLARLQDILVPPLVMLER